MQPRDVPGGPSALQQRLYPQQIHQQTQVKAALHQNPSDVIEIIDNEVGPVDEDAGAGAGAALEPPACFVDEVVGEAKNYGLPLYTTPTREHDVHIEKVPHAPGCLQVNLHANSRLQTL
jgi:hypothetical protein